MGVPIGESRSDLAFVLECKNCDRGYETDETTTNECPYCGLQNWEVAP